MKALRLHTELDRIWRNDAGWKGVFTSVNHTDLGKRFIFTSFVFFAIGGVLAMLIRAQLATPDSAFVGPEVYNQLFTMHGSIMMFLFAIPLIEGVAVYLLPKILGARDLAYPRLTALGWWCYLFGGLILITAMLVGYAPDAGWFLYPPLSGKEFTPGINSDVWLLGITFVEISAICAAIEIIVTILKFRAANMSLDRMPIMAWYLLATAAMMIFGFPPLILGSILLEVERAFGWPFYTPELGGSPLLWQHLFWLFGHPEVYIIFLPAAGAISTILPVMARTRLLGYGSIIAAIFALAFLSFGLWVHHMFATGIPMMALGFFSVASTLVAIPTAVQIFAWLGTLWIGRPERHLPMLYIVGFFVTFVIGGLTGVMLAVVPFDLQAHDTAFVTAHLHYVLVGGFVFPMLAATYYWLPHFTGRGRILHLGEAAFWLIFIGFNVTFFLMHLVGLLGMPRRIDTYPADIGWTAYNLVSSFGAFILAFGFGLFLIDVLMQFWMRRDNVRNVWRAGTLEWAMPTPAPSYNFASLPTVSSRDPLYVEPDMTLNLVRGEGLLAKTRNQWRETLAVDTVTGRPDYIALLPGNSALPFYIAAVLGGFFLSVLFGAYILAPLFMIGVLILGWRWCWSLGEREDIGLIDAGDGFELKTSGEANETTGWLGSILTIAASATLFGSLLFGYSFLWTVAPNWPPEVIIDRVVLQPIILLGAIAVVLFSTRSALRSLHNGKRPQPGLLMTLIAQGTVTAIMISLIVILPPPTSHAYAATAISIAAYATFHSALATVIATFAWWRVILDYVSPARDSDLRVLLLWSDYALGSAAIAMFAIALPGWIG